MEVGIDMTNRQKSVLTMWATQVSKDTKALQVSIDGFTKTLKNIEPLVEDIYNHIEKVVTCSKTKGSYVRRNRHSWIKDTKLQECRLIKTGCVNGELKNTLIEIIREVCPSLSSRYWYCEMETLKGHYMNQWTLIILVNRELKIESENLKYKGFSLTDIAQIQHYSQRLYDLQRSNISENLMI